MSVSRRPGDVSRDPSRPPQAVADRWGNLLEDARATAAEYREDGWETLVVHTAEVGVLAGERFGLDVVAPDNEFDDLRALADRATFGESRVFRAEASGVRFLLVVAEATATRNAVLVPVYLPVDNAGPLRERAREEGAMYTHVRTIADRERVTVGHEDPGPFF